MLLALLGLILLPGIDGSGPGLGLFFLVCAGITGLIARAVARPSATDIDDASLEAGGDSSYEPDL